MTIFKSSSLKVAPAGLIIPTPSPGCRCGGLIRGKLLLTTFLGIREKLRAVRAVVVRN
jgi:hypothetical protein